MKTKTAFLFCIVTALFVTCSQAQFITNTFSFSGASWNDGGSLDGFFTVEYDLTNTPVTLLSFDITTGDGTSDGFLGYEYVYNVDGKTDTAGPGWMNFQNDQPTFISAAQNDGAPANELSISPLDNSERWVFLDWQGSSPTELYVGDVGGQYSSESYFGDSATRYINSVGGSAGTVPEPSWIALAGLGFFALLVITYLRKAATRKI